MKGVHAHEAIKKKNDEEEEQVFIKVMNGLVKGTQQTMEDEQPDVESYGWSASQKVMERLNQPPRAKDVSRPKVREAISWQRGRREAVKREVETFLKAEDRRQTGIKNLVATINSIDKLDTDFGSFSQFGRTLRSELEVLKKKLKATQKTFVAADGGFLQTYALARRRRIRDAERCEGRDGEFKYDENVGKARISDDGRIHFDEDDESILARRALEQEVRQVDLRLENIWSHDVMLDLDIEGLLEDAKAIKASCKTTMLNLDVSSNDLHVRIEDWYHQISKMVGALTEDTETTYDMEHTITPGSVDQYLTESKIRVDQLISSMETGREKALEASVQYTEKSLEISADLRAENERLLAELSAKDEEKAAALREKELELKHAQAEADRQRKILVDDYKRLTLSNDQELELLSSRYRAQLDAANKALEEETAKAEELEAKLAQESEQYRKTKCALADTSKTCDALMQSIESERARALKLESALLELKQQLEAATAAGSTTGGDDSQVALLEAQLKTVRKNLEIQENKAVQLVGAIRTLEKEKTSLKKHAARLQEKVSGVDSAMLDTIAMAESNFDAMIGGTTGKERLPRIETRVSTHKRRDRESALEALNKRQEEEQTQAKEEVEEEVAKREQGLETQKQVMLAKLGVLQAQMPPRGHKHSLEKKTKKKKSKAASFEAAGGGGGKGAVLLQLQQHGASPGDAAQSQPHETFITSNMGDEQEESEEESGEEGQDEEMRRVLEKQRQQIEEEMRVMEEEHRNETADVESINIATCKRGMADLQHREDERLRKLHLAAAQAQETIANDASEPSDSDDEDLEVFGENETHNVPDDIERLFQVTDSAVSGIQQVIQLQHQKMAEILETKEQESKAEIIKVKAKANFNLAVGLLVKKKAAPSEALADVIPEPAATSPTAPVVVVSRTSSVVRSESVTPPIPAIQPLGKATTLPAPQAPASGWVPLTNAHTHKRASRRIRSMRAPAILQKEYADLFGGQHRIQTPALLLQPGFVARQEPPTLTFQPRDFFYGQPREKPQRNLPRPETARARLQQDESQRKDEMFQHRISHKFYQDDSSEASRQVIKVHETSQEPTRQETSREPTRQVHKIETSLSESPRRPMSARIPQKAANTEYQDALERCWRPMSARVASKVVNTEYRDVPLGFDQCLADKTVLLPDSPQNHLLQIQGITAKRGVDACARPLGAFHFKWPMPKGIRPRQTPMDKNIKITLSTQQLAAERERAIGGMLASSPAPSYTSPATSRGRPNVGTFADFESKMFSSARLLLRARSPSKNLSPGPTLKTTPRL